MRFNVEGADPQSGHERVIAIDARDEREAEALAARQGLLVSAVYRSTVEDALQELAQAAAPKPTVKAAPVAYRSPPTSQQLPPSVPMIPEYSGLRFGGNAFYVLAGLAYLGGALTIVVFMMGAGSALRFGAGPAAVVTLIAGFLAALWPFAVGVTFHALASACHALRDIARNSFRYS